MLRYIYIYIYIYIHTHVYDVTLCLETAESNGGWNPRSSSGWRYCDVILDSASERAKGWGHLAKYSGTRLLGKRVLGYSATRVLGKRVGSFSQVLGWKVWANSGHLAKYWWGVGEGQRAYTSAGSRAFRRFLVDFCLDFLSIPIWYFMLSLPFYLILSLSLCLQISMLLPLLISVLNSVILGYLEPCYAALFTQTFCCTRGSAIGDKTFESSDSHCVVHQSSRTVFPCFIISPILHQ